MTKVKDYSDHENTVYLQKLYFYWKTMSAKAEHKK